LNDKSDTHSGLKVGDPAPDFTLPTHNEGELNLGWYRGRKNVLIAFFPAAWTPVCATHVPNYQHDIAAFDKLDCQILGVSVDSLPSLTAWAKSLGGLSFPLMSDFWPHGEVASKYGVLYERKGFSERTIFVVDKRGTIRYIENVPIAEVPDNRKVLDVLSDLQKEHA
jgi:peroxiredoxin (alkyl hydroperoxide reductase subunit C)